MGYNTPILLLNDAEHMLGQDPTIGERLGAAVREATCYSRPVDCFVRNDRSTSSAFTVLPALHADATQVVVIGGNSIRRIAELYYCGSDPDKILKALADQLGYRVVRKPVRK